MHNYIYPKYTGLAVLSLICAAVLFLGCADVKQIPGQVKEDIPNPIGDFTEKDNFMIGLEWYQQGQFDIAKKFWDPLSERGDCDAEYAMGLLYYTGLGVRRSHDNAIMLWTRAAEQAQPQAQVALGSAYSKLNASYLYIDCRKGCGVDKNLQNGYMWFGLASEYGSPREIRESEKAISKISSEMTPEQIGNAQADIEAWEPRPSKCKSRRVIVAAPRSIRSFY